MAFLRGSFCILLRNESLIIGTIDSATERLALFSFFRKNYYLLNYIAVFDFEKMWENTREEIIKIKMKEK